MLETIYTIPVNEAFEAGLADKTKACPFCRLYEKLQNIEVDTILGASMMEPDVRIKTNEQGFCDPHYRMMLSSKNKLGLALILESHLAKLRQDMKEGVGDLLKGKGQTASGRIERLHESCYVCGRIETSLSKMIENAVYLWEQDSDFRTKLKGQPCLCLRHFKRFADAGRRSLNKKRFADFYSEIETLTMSYLESLKEDISWFCKKFDYRYDQEPWGDAKDAVERSIDFLK